MKPEMMALGRRLLACPLFEWRIGMMAASMHVYPWQESGTLLNWHGPMQRPLYGVVCYFIEQVGPIAHWYAEDEGWGDNWQLYNGWTCPPDAFPDLTDPGTIGHLLALVREAHGDPCLYVGAVSTGVAALLGWAVFRREMWGMVIVARGSTEGEALVEALSSASREKG